MFERIKELCRKRGISVNDLENSLGYSKNTLYRLKTQNPGADKLKDIADYFDVSVDYLLGRTDNLHIEEASMAKQVMMRMDTAGISEKELEEIESEMERFFSWRIEEIKKEKDE